GAREMRDRRHFLVSGIGHTRAHLARQKAELTTRVEEQSRTQRPSVTLRVARLHADEPIALPDWLVDLPPAEDVAALASCGSQQMPTELVAPHLVRMRDGRCHRSIEPVVTLHPAVRRDERRALLTQSVRKRLDRVVHPEAVEQRDGVWQKRLADVKAR